MTTETRIVHLDEIDDYERDGWRFTGLATQTGQARTMARMERPVGDERRTGEDE